MEVGDAEGMLAWGCEQEANKLNRSKRRKDTETGKDYTETLKGMAVTPKPRAPWLICSEPTAEGLHWVPLGRRARCAAACVRQL